MADGTTEIDIAREPDDVWRLVREFGGLESWMPGIEACKVDGDVRTIATMGIEIQEQLRERDDERRRIAYGIVASPMPLEHHYATITVDPAAGGSHVTYTVEVRPDEMLPAFLPAYEGALKTLKSNLESSS